MKKLFVLSFIISSISFAQGRGTWTLTDPLKIPRQYAASVELVNGNILVTGGEDSVSINTTEIFDYKNEKWEIAPPMIVGRGSHVMVQLKNGNVIAIGGFGTKSCEIFDTLSKHWNLTDSLHEERSYGETATLLDNGNVLVVGGFYLSVHLTKGLKSCEIYDAPNSKWTLIDSLKLDRYYHTATKLLDGRVLFVGGSSYEEKGEINDCEIYDPTTGKWIQVAHLNVARYEHTASLLPDGKVLVTGGVNYTNDQSPWLSSCELYDPIQNTWTVVGSMLYPRASHSAIILKSGLILLAGGDMNNTTWELYDLNTFSSIYSNSYPGKQLVPSINLLPTGKVISAGGTTWTDGSLPVISSTKMCYIYDPNGINAVEQPKINLPKEFKLYQNYPNPFNPTTIIKYELPKTSHVVIKIYNSIGAEITTLINQTQLVGSYSVNFNAKGLSSGVYFYQIIANDWISTNKMLLIK
jgi:N-acetylneuraminic acid mutarotase